MEKGIPTQNGEGPLNVLVNVRKAVGGAIQGIEMYHRLLVPHSDAKNIVVPLVRRKKRGTASSTRLGGGGFSAVICISSNAPAFVDNHMSLAPWEVSDQVFLRKRKKCLGICVGEERQRLRTQDERQPRIRIVCVAQLK